MDDKQQLIQQFTKKKRDLTAKLDRLMKPVEEVKEELAALNKALALFLRDDEPEQEDGGNFPMYRLRNKTQLGALLEIADYHGGTLDTGYARRLLVESKLMKDTKNTSQMINLLINRSGAFERIGRGQYRLIASRSKTPDEKFYAVPVHPSKPVQ